MKYFTRGDVDGFFAIALDNLVQLLLVVTLLTGAAGLSGNLVYGTILPGVAVSFVVGNLFYAWQAHRLAKRENRTDVCAMPYGLNTPTMIAYTFLVIIPAKQLAISQGLPDPDRVAWQAGLVACVGSGLIEFFGSFISETLRRLTPRAALLAALSGAGLAFLVYNYFFQLFAHPLVGLPTLALVFVFYFGGLKPRGGVPAALVVLGLGLVLCWCTGLAPHGAQPNEGLRFALPSWCGGVVWQGLTGGQLLPYLSIILPIGLLNLLASMQCVESAAAAGDRYSTRSSLAMNGLGTLSAAFFGSPFATSIYIGHPAWKRMGARAGYSTANAIFISLICFTGSLLWIAWAVPTDAGLAIIVWIGLIIAVQSFEVTPPKHWPAVLVGIAPVVLAWAVLQIKNAARLGGLDFNPTLLTKFHATETFLDGGFALEQGTFYAALIWATITVYIVERKFKTAAVWSLFGSALCLIGLMHAWRFNGADTAAALPLLGWAMNGGPALSLAELFPAWRYALAYALVAGVLLSVKSFTTEDTAAEAPKS